MLQAQAVLEDGSGNVIATADNPNTLGQTISTTVSAGTYYLVVESSEFSTGVSVGQGYDIGEYTVTGVVAPAAASSAATFAISGSSSVNEQSAYTLSLSANDLGQTVSNWTLNWGDGSIQTVAGNPSSVTHTYADGPNNYTITATATDGTGTYNAGNTVSVAVAHVAPTVALSGSANASAGTPYVLGLSGIEDAGHTISSWLVNWGDGSSSNITGNPSSATHTYAAGPNAYTITALAIDDVNAYASSNNIVVNVTATPILTSIVITPSSPSIFDGQTNQFTATAYDQFGQILTTQPAFTWSVGTGGAGTISPTGLYSAPASGPASDVVTASSGSITGTATAAVILSVIDGPGNELIHLVRSATMLSVYINSSAPLYSVPYATLGSLSIIDGGGVNTVNVDFSGGASPVPTGGLSINGSNGTTALVVTGTSGNDSATVNANTLTFDTSPINYTGLQSIAINGAGGADSLIQTAQPGDGAILSFNTTATNSLNISAGTFSFAPPTATLGVQPLPLASLTIGSTATIALGSAASHSDRWVLTLGSLNLSPLSQLDLGDNDMISLDTGSYPAISAELATGFNGGNWTGPGIVASAARTDLTHLSSLGVVQAPAATTFDNQPISAGEVLVKYTYTGDATLDGRINASDYSRIDYGFLTHLSGWTNGDFNYDGIINGSDYTLIDNAFNNQGASLASELSPAAVAPAPMAPSSAAIFASSATPIAGPTEEAACMLFLRWYEGTLSNVG
jgi:hypothetical protein